jgi:hypothetical protein
MGLIPGDSLPSDLDEANNRVAAARKLWHNRHTTRSIARFLSWNCQARLKNGDRQVALIFA